jgi:hypothetical protein
VTIAGVIRAVTLLSALGLCGLASAQVAVYFDQPGMRLRSASATARGGAWDLTLTMGDDNGDGSLPTSFRRWWHCGIRGLSPHGERLDVAVTNAGYTDIILPVWSLSSDGRTFGPWVRLPPSAVPVRSGSTHRFTVDVPPGVVELRLAKYFPYSIADKDALVQRVGAAPRFGLTAVLGSSRQGRPIELLSLTDTRVPGADKHRVWIHAGIHPAETTSYFVVEGLVDELLSGSPLARLALGRLVFQIVPMANPDGVALGNYRTNAASVNLENEWAAPYDSPEPEIRALRTAIELRMGTPSRPADHPLAVVLNLHASHGLAWPFHFEHVANPNFDLVASRSGVIPEVNALERRWIAAFRAASPFVAAGTTQTSTAGAPSRPFVESMLHDRWTIDPQWRATNEAVMAITFEGTYGPGPGTAWNGPDDWRRVGREMVAALVGYFGLTPGGWVGSDLSPCADVTLNGQVQAGAVRVDLDCATTAPGSIAALVFGLGEVALPLPGSACTLRVDPLVAVPAPLDALGRARLSLLPPPGAIRLHVQAVALPGSSNTLELLTLR